MKVHSGNINQCRTMIAMSSSKPIMVLPERKPYHTIILGLKHSTKLCLICCVG
jgi:hypothetical protein